MLPLVLLVSTSDAPSEVTINEQHSKFQHTLLTNLFQDINPQWMTDVRLESLFQEFHFKQEAWHGAPVHRTCMLRFVKGYLQQIYVTHWGSRIGRFSPEFFPHCVSDLQIEGCDQQYHLETRYLPREATIVNFSRNSLLGNIDLHNLPPKINVMNMRRNALSGALLMAKLPMTANTIDLAQNTSLGQSVVWYAEIPEKLTRVDLRGTKVRKVRPIFEEMETWVNVFLVGNIKRK
mmetsp:Transcript_8517/g.12904  ORF Transcript_8517/g.12904 Transcript_8517/m.12904 type:complete len:234 (-) Transcript_8517:18-719(-)